MPDLTTQQLQSRIHELEAEVKKLNLMLQKDSKMKYGLRWIDVPEAFEKESENSIPILEEVKENAIKNDDGKPTHVLIEGDNFHALKCLNYTHKGKIDVIYIDPPYNTENGFVYHDKRVMDKFPDGVKIDVNHPLRHSAWLSFMSKRLELAEKLLSKKGVIFISIDDNEQANLRLLCDKIFGEKNFVAEFVIASNSAKNNSKSVSITHEYLICYAKDKIKLSEQQWKVSKTNLEDFKNITKSLFQKGLSSEEIHKELLSLVKYPKYYEFDHYTYVDEKGPFQASDLTAPESKARYEILHPISNLPCKQGTRGWGYSELEMKKLIETNYILFGEDESTIPRLKNYLFENEMSLPRSVLFFDSQSSTKWMKSQKFNFDFPKAVEYIQFILSMVTTQSSTCKEAPLFATKFLAGDSNPRGNSQLSTVNSQSSIILDFFAGSGTTLHATMKLNESDGGNRQCILVQQDENGICQNVTYERNRRVMQGYENSKGEKVAGLGNSLKYYKTAFVGKNDAINATDSDRIALAQKAGCLLSLAENTLEEIERSEFYQIFSDGKSGCATSTYTGIYFSGNFEQLPEFCERLEQLRDESRLNRINAYFFCQDNGEEFENEFSSMKNIEFTHLQFLIIQ